MPIAIIPDMAKKTTRARRHRCQDCGILLPAADFENDPDICWRCWQDYRICKKCNEYKKKGNLLYAGKGDYMCLECADACGFEEEDDG